ncbi:MAG: hypothetical protein NTX06_12870 [Proteobacteria bacterium]|nr:hypothetical protein [Pseudomonadota bacterium]
MRTGELLVKAARAVQAIGMISLPGSLARIEHGQTKQKFTIGGMVTTKRKMLWQSINLF